MREREIINAKQGRQFAIHNLAEQIAPVISEQIQETIAWQSDGYEFAEHLEDDDYIQFANEVRTEILKQLQDI
jgi:hypothetical protein